MGFGQDPDFEFFNDGRTQNWGTGWDDSKPFQDDPLAKSAGKLIAWDPIAQKERWHVNQEALWNGGVLVTGDLVFQGTGKGDIKAYDANTGEELWSFPLQTGIVAPPVTYMVDEVQYITIVAGWGGGLATWVKWVDQLNPAGIYTFALDGKEPTPEFEKLEEQRPINIDFEATEAELRNGQYLYNRHCIKCHGGGEIPDLNYSRPEIFEIFPQIVGQGAFIGKGMPNYGDRFSEQEILDIKHYILSQTRIKSIGIIGSALETGWEESVKMRQIEESQWEIELSLNAGELKFRANNDWSLNWGGNTLPRGDLIRYGNNFILEEGKYHIVFDLTTYNYLIERIAD